MNSNRAQYVHYTDSRTISIFLLRCPKRADHTSLASPRHATPPKFHRVLDPLADEELINGGAAAVADDDDDPTGVRRVRTPGGKQLPAELRPPPPPLADKPKRFWYARLMFGMERILGFSEAEKQGIRPNGSTVISMAAVVYLADARVEDPILGAYGRILKLQQQLDRLKAERARQHHPATSSPAPADDVALQPEPFHQPPAQPSTPPALAIPDEEEEEDNDDDEDEDEEEGQEEGEGHAPADDDVPCAKRRKHN